MDHTSQVKAKALTDTKILKTAILDSFRKLHPRTMVKNPVMFVVEVGAVLTSIQLVREALQPAGQFGFGLQITLWLWFTVLFANFAEAMAEGRGKAQADTLRKARAETQAHRLRTDGSIEFVVSSNPGETFLDRMIKLVEGASRQKTPNEIALNILLAGLTIIFLLAVVTLQPFAIYSGAPQSIFVLVSLLVCLIPTTIGGLLSAIGIAGMDRMIQRNVIAMSGRAVEASGDVDVLLLDKTGTITLGNRAATQFFPAPGVDEAYLADAAQLSSLADETPEGRSIVVLAKERYNLRGRDLSTHAANFIPFSAQTRMSGVDLDGREIRKGALEAISRLAGDRGNSVPAELQVCVREISNAGGTPLQSLARPESTISSRKPSRKTRWPSSRGNRRRGSLSP